MKILVLVVLLAGVGLFMDAAIEGYLGHARAYAPGSGASLVDVEADRAPGGFAGIMAYQRIRAVLCTSAGWFLWSRLKRADAWDPFMVGREESR